MTTHIPHADRALTDRQMTEAATREAVICDAPAREAADPERLAYLDGLKVQIRKGVYQADIRDLARSLASMLVRDL